MNGVSSCLNGCGYISKEFPYIIYNLINPYQLCPNKTIQSSMSSLYRPQTSLNKDHPPLYTPLYTPRQHNPPFTSKTISVQTPKFHEEPRKKVENHERRWREIFREQSPRIAIGRSTRANRSPNACTYQFAFGTNKSRVLNAPL